MKKVSDIQVGDKVMLNETGFQYVVTWLSDASILVQGDGKKFFIPKILINIMNTMRSTHGYTLFKFKDLPTWFVEKNGIN